MTHYDLCKLTAERFVKKAQIALYEYKSGSYEEPDVLTFNYNVSTLYEIKMSRSDFKADKMKECRTKWKPKGYWNFKNNPNLIKFDAFYKQYWPELYYIEAPHLGKYRYYVCPSGLLKPEEIPEGWGLYWVKNGRFYKKKASKSFKRNLFAENNILVHALRRLGRHGPKGILFRIYQNEVI
ncbi:MAG: adenylosuccinate synthase [Candidatus Stahlbacteria bacterium]|nr:MAG: adenylosuccinate synthase [Candidatus Stahlbacteria bacterium]